MPTREIDYLTAARAMYGITLGMQAFLRTLEGAMGGIVDALSAAPRWRRAERERRLNRKYSKNRTIMLQRLSHLQTPAQSKMHADYRRKKR